MRAVHLAEGLRLFEDVPDAAARNALLRLHLAETIGCALDALVIAPDARGKPRLTWPTPRLFFNVSHRARLLLVGLSWDRPVGVDLELAKSGKETGVCPDGGPTDASEAGNQAVARAFFAPDEAAWLDSLPQEARPLAFLRLWTAKEAALKAAGLGIGGGLREPDLAPLLASGQVPEWRPTLVETGGKRYELEWFFLSTADGAACAARALTAQGC